MCWLTGHGVMKYLEDDDYGDLGRGLGESNRVEWGSDCLGLRSWGRAKFRIFLRCLMILEDRRLD